jgi:hypothetical protein
VAGNTNNLIEGNFIGTEGALEVGNEGAGIVIFLQSTDNIIGGADPAARNVISGNGRQGISFNSSSNTVQGNYIGTDRTGTIAIPNGFQGVAFFGSVSASGNVVGGVNPGEGNLISGNNLSGVALVENVSDTQILGNFIGTDVTGTVDLGNVQHGVLLDDGIFGAPSGNFIGGDAGTTPGGPCTGACNLISGNGMDGVHLEGVGTDGNTVQGNLITFNETGVFVVDGIDNAILANSIFSNNQLGIDLQTIGIDPNDSGDGDTGGNNLQNFPELSSALSANGNLTIDGTLNSSPDTTYLLEFFANDACDPSGNGEGQTFLGSADVTTDGSGSAAIQADLPAPAAAGPVLTATATDPAGNTSEFSNCVTVVLGETCDNGVDDDGDGFQDCDDSECADFATCLGNGTADGGGCSLQGGLKSRSYPFLLLGMLLASMGFMLRRVSR